MNESELELEGKSVTDETLRTLRNLKTIKALSLINTVITDDGFGVLHRARALDEIVIISDRLTGQSLRVLPQLPSLRSLQIHRGPRIDDSGMAHVARCVGLNELYLIDTAVTDAGLSPLEGLSEVWSLWLDGTAISDEGCRVSSSLPRLSLLGLGRTRATGRGLASLRHHEHLDLYMDETPVTDEDVGVLAEQMVNLELISLCNTAIGDATAHALARLRGLNEARLSGTRLTDVGLAAFAGHPRLEALEVEGCRVSRRAVRKLEKVSPCDLTVYGP